MEITGSTVILQPGIYILRHPTGNKAALSIARAPGTPATQGRMELLSTAGTHGSVLRDGADCIVLHISDAPVTLLVSAFLENKNAPVPALRVDQIALERGSVPPPMRAPADAAPSTPAHAAPIAIGAQGISLIGHVERHGDVMAPPGALLGDPDSLLRLEGFQVMWPDRPHGVDLAYSIAVEGGGVLPMVKSGKFCGTRNEARRIIEVSFALIGPAASQWRLEGTAHFSGGYQVPVQAAVPLSGPSGLEHLTAITLHVQRSDTGASERNPWLESATTKVFKATAAQAEREQSANRDEEFAS
ncbi:hypothetical protein IV454_29355 [Massilia antarctica]|uniref:Uncharacterized protein n=1 Tax=Massilia antarctica TaxID=2765360 RepID=A0AA48WDZ7_9BURK|nr:hypothetical protein [Massilia antarctica]QPI49495.1 hypothetical protein IV454_29355 [Massilia antarctica]